MSGPAAELPTEPPASRRHAGRRSLPPSFSLVAAAGAPLRSLHVKPAAAYTKDVRRTSLAPYYRAFPHPDRRRRREDGPNDGHCLPRRYDRQSQRMRKRLRKGSEEGL